MSFAVAAAAVETVRLLRLEVGVDGEVDPLTFRLGDEEHKESWSML